MHASHVSKSIKEQTIVSSILFLNIFMKGKDKIEDILSREKKKTLSKIETEPTSRYRKIEWRAKRWLNFFFFLLIFGGKTKLSLR